MIVIDASAMVDFLLGITPCSEVVEHALTQTPGAAPHLLDVEIAQVLRRFVRKNTLTSTRAMAAFSDLSSLRLTRYEHGPLLNRAFELRDNVTIYDAVYLALAEALNAEFITRDKALKNVPECKAKVRVI